MTYFQHGSRWLGLLVAVVLAGPTGLVAQQELAQLDRPRFMRPIPGGRAAEELDVTRVPVLRRRVSLDRAGTTVAELLREVTRQTGLRFAYNAEALPVDRVVELRASSITVAAALTEILVDLGVDVLLKSSSQAVLVPRRAVRQTGTIVGRVIDGKSKAGVVGAEVLLQGTQWRTVTDTGGRYRLLAVDSGNYTLSIRRLGYRKESLRVLVREEREDTINVVLEPVAAKLDELVTTATGQQRRRDIGNAITTIHADSVLKNAPIRNLTDLLANRVPGLTTRHTTGAPGDPARLRLRGLGSALRSNDPVVVVDGVRVYAAQAEARGGNLTNLLDPEGLASGRGTPAPSPLDQIDPNIIDKIEVFKGPSAATLYGADAANGVIVITTKRGKPGPTRWNASVTYGRTTQPGRWPTGYYRWGHDLFDDGTRFCTLVDVRCVADSLVQFQALNEPSLTLLGQGRRTALSLTASGGTQALTYSVTGGYGDEAGLLRLPAFEIARFRERHQREAPAWMRRPHHYKTWGVTSNVTARLGATANVTLATSLARSEQQRTELENQLTPLMGTYIDTVNGRYYQNGNGGAFDATGTILRDYYRRTTASTLTVTTGLNASWRPRAWFTASGQAGLNVVPRDDQALLPGGLLALTDSGSLARGTGRSLVSTFNVQGAVRQPLGRGFVFRTSLGANWSSLDFVDTGFRPLV